ncbi:MAG: hypothetical protein QNM02_08430 [Acidimicrobiia bacterium]|nr:hypothetical protein [Acidimicrobiia bacterium]
MNLFRSEEHARNWGGFDDSMSSGLKPLAEWADIFSNPFFRERGRRDYISWTRSDAGRDAFIALRERLPRRDA